MTGGNYNYQFQEITELPKHQNLLKLDFNPTSRDKISFRGRTWWSDRRGYEGLAAFNSNWDQLYHHYLFTEDSIQGSYTRIFSPTVVNEFTYNRRILGEDGSFKPLGSFTPNVDPVTRSKEASLSASSTLAAIRLTWFRFFRSVVFLRRPTSPSTAEPPSTVAISAGPSRTTSVGRGAATT